MGYIVHDYVIVTSWKDEHLSAAREIAVSLFETSVTPIYEHIANHYRTFFILSSGSKNGWATKEEHLYNIGEFLKFLRQRNYFVDAVVVHMPEEIEQSYIGNVLTYEEKDE